MTNRGRFNEFLRRKFDRLLSMSDYKLAAEIWQISFDNTTHELFKNFLHEQNYDFIVPIKKLALWLGSNEEDYIK